MSAASSEDDDLEFRINTKFAESYDNWRRKEELQKLKDKYGEQEEPSSSSGEEEDDDAEGLTPQIQKDFLKTLSFVKSRDPRIYSKETTFYHSQEESSEDDAGKSDKKMRKKSKDDKPFYLKDYERHIITQKGGRYSDEEDEDGDEEETDWNERDARPASPTYMQEQEMLKKSFREALKGSDSEDGGEGSSFLTKKERTAKEKNEDEREYIRWMKGQKETVEDEVEAKDAAEMDALRKYWRDPSLEEGEKFLRDFILDKGYMNKTTDEVDSLPLDLDEAGFSEDEKLLDAQDEFERKFNFRFEEPDAEFIKRYPRTMSDSVRVEDNKRAVKRQNLKARKEQEKSQKQEDLKRLKNLKKQEIMDKLERLRQATGNTTVGFEDVDLEGDFDPAEHDRAMEKVFSSEYDSLTVEQTKPEFQDEDWQEETWDTWEGREELEEFYDENEDFHYEDSNFNMDADYDPSLSERANKERNVSLEKELMGNCSRKKRRKLSKFAEALYAKKPVFNPNEKNFEQYVEEFYKLEYEDMIGDLPCRFKYRRVIPNDFGLLTEEILAAKEHELNQWTSLKKTCQYRTEEEEMQDVRFYAKKGKNEAKKRRVFLSLQEIVSDSNDDSDTNERPKGRTRSKRRRKPDSDSRKQVDSSLDEKNQAAKGLRQVSKEKDNPNKKVFTVERKGFDKSLNLEGKATIRKVSGEEATVTDRREDADNTPKSKSSKDSDEKVLAPSTKETIIISQSDPTSATNQSNDIPSSSVTKRKRKRKRRAGGDRIDHDQKKVQANPIDNKDSDEKVQVPAAPLTKETNMSESNPTSATNKTDIPSAGCSSNVTRKRKRKRKRRPSGDYSSPKNTPANPIDSKDPDENLQVPASSIKKTNMSQSNPTSATNQTDDVPSAGSSSKVTTKRKRKRKRRASGDYAAHAQKNQNNSKQHQDGKDGTQSEKGKLTPQVDANKASTVKVDETTRTPKSIDFSLVKKFIQRKPCGNSDAVQTKPTPNPVKTQLQKPSPAPGSPPSVAAEPAKPKRKDSQTTTKGKAATSKKVCNRTRNKNRNRRLVRPGQETTKKMGRSGPGSTVSDARLKAYGINPKKHGFRMKFLRDQRAANEEVGKSLDK